ncbi:VENN motif pre-toxin domain-containing protein [Acerihabitans sp. TG2]|uniref:VENN motif pre-toxin domain-containing protein n=1 Tax=Acerihabitans sp. TG2 TaxID=3096008 RepID=UPI002B22E30B|nr:VENN motif pre-toxin domain-containing protein [Acerihabitans sp. TG2]MEA9393599.1 VENN motif pre-toxin domain-containing protein [Acerihabitans sp. TG2]
MGGNVQGAAVGAVAPYLANLVKQISAEDEPLRVVLHTALGAFLAAAQGGNATAGAAGALASAASASTAEKLARLIFNSGPNDTLTEDQKQVIDNLVVIAGSVAGGVVGGGLSGVGSGANTAKNEVENNSLSDIAQAQSEGKALEQKAGEYVEAENERYRKANCGGMSAEACSVKMYTERREALKETALTGADFVPVVGDIKSFAEAQSALDYVAAAIGLIPGVGDAAGKAIKTAETALKKGGCG